MILRFYNEEDKLYNTHIVPANCGPLSISTNIEDTLYYPGLKLEAPWEIIITSGGFDSKSKLLAEIDRLKKGNFTEEEFQNLCHNLSEDDYWRFKQDYQKKLFGK